MLSVAEKDPGILEHKQEWLEKGIIIPTFNAAPYWTALHGSLQAQGIPPDQVLIIDSSSQDGTGALARADGYKVVSIDQKDFDHGGTRQMACGLLPEAQELLFLTQDAILNSPRSALNLFRALEDPEVGVAFGRQLPRPQANAIERHARYFNYPARSYQRSFEQRRIYGVKSFFCSNSFAVYRRSALDAVGGFPSGAIFGEDACTAARMLIAGWKIAYRADATVIHSHGLSLTEEFQRYFSIGLFHGREIWMLETFGFAGGEGLRFVRSELAYIAKYAPFRIPEVLVRTASKMLAYQLGLREKKLPLRIKRVLCGIPSLVA